MKLTNNFSKSEFDCKCGCKMPPSVLVNVVKAADNLQILRDCLGESIIINSAYRCKDHNKKVGGKTNSSHLKGLATDITAKGSSVDLLNETIEHLIESGSLKQGGLGLYNTFVHYDIRGKKARWDNTSNNG